MILYDNLATTRVKPGIHVFSANNRISNRDACKIFCYQQFAILVSFFHLQVDVLCGYKETESLVEELMKMKIPDYKPTSNHVHLSDKGGLTCMVD